MKHISAIVLVFILTVAVAAAVYTTGYGRELTATTTSARVTGFTANSLSFFNQGTNTLHALVNCSTNTFDARLTAGTTVAIPADTAYTFSMATKRVISSFCYATTNESSGFVVGGL